MKREDAVVERRGEGEGRWGETCENPVGLSMCDGPWSLL